MNEQERYEYFQKKREMEWEALCGRCGACCGSVEDPCEHLRGEAPGEYFCAIYENRFGPHKTVSGKEFTCVHIRKILHETWPGDECCGYKKDPTL